MAGLLQGRSALITGGARGLGEGIAKAVLEAGGRVLVTDVNPAVTRTAAALDPGGQRCRAALLDVRDENAFQDVFAAAISAFGAVDLLVNNAGLTPSRRVWDITTAEWDDVMAVNLRSAFLGCRIAGRHMRERGSGRIVNMASLAGQRGGAVAGAHYSASKAGIIVLTKVFAQELAPCGVTVNAVAPAAISGPITAEMPRDKVEAMARAIPIGRLGRDDEVGAAVVYLASEAAGFVTGATLDVNGGLSMR